MRLVKNLAVYKVEIKKTYKVKATEQIHYSSIHTLHAHKLIILLLVNVYISICV